MTKDRAIEDFDAWNPGLNSGIPRELLPLVSMFRPENISNSLAEIEELSQFSGIDKFDLAAFRPERLIAHEVLVRVSADLTVPDGPNYEDLGLHMRGMVAMILDRHVAAHMIALTEAFDALGREVTDFLGSELGLARCRWESSASKVPEKTSLLGRLLGSSAPVQPKRLIDHEGDPLSGVLADWSARAADVENPAHSACLNSLVEVVNKIIGTRGRVVGDDDVLVKLATIRVLNGFGARKLGELVEPIFRDACVAEGYRVLPPQSDPCIMNVKGASASGKSTMRSLQRELAERTGIPWEDFALISPDYWRKFLIDYETVGESFKYAAVLTGHELAIVDRKLDDYMARKAEDGQMSHLLIDRFRFDSFSAAGGGEAQSRLLSRFGKTVYMFFVVTPPEETIERAWLRGSQTGRYKAVDDLLYHNVEAFTGMPELFFLWAFSELRRVHFEFLDNGVPFGERPYTIASGWNRELTVFDVDGMLNIARFKKINIEASRREEVYQASAHADEDNLGFLQQCADRLDKVEFIHPGTQEVCGVVEKGRWVWIDETAIESAMPILLRLNLSRASLANAGENPAEAVDTIEEKIGVNLGRMPSSQ